MLLNLFQRKQSLSRDNDKLERIAEHYANGDITKQEFIKLQKKLSLDNIIPFLGCCFSNMLSIQTKHAQNIMRREGRTTGYAPLGYKNVRIEGEATVIVDKKTAPIIKNMFEYYATACVNLEKLCEIANSRGLRTKNIHQLLTKRDIFRLLTNKYYCGYGTHKGQIFRHKYPCIVEERLFDRCQLILRNNGLIK